MKMEDTVNVYIVGCAERVPVSGKVFGPIAITHTVYGMDGDTVIEGDTFEITLCATGHSVLAHLKQRKALKLAKEMHAWEEWKALDADPQKAMKDFAFMRALRDKVYALRDEVAQ